MLRNLNQSISGKRICGTPHSGVLGSLIPSIGENGPGYLYESLDLPADTNNEYRGYITSVPAGLNIYAYEDTSFEAWADADGTYQVDWDLEENGIYLDSTHFNLTFGSGTVIISCTVGNAVVAGMTATIHASTKVVIQCSVGNAIARGRTATIRINGIVPNAGSWQRGLQSRRNRRNIGTYTKKR